MASLDELKNERIKKRQLLIDAGMDVYRASTGRDISIKDLRGRFEEIKEEKRTVTVAGRVMAMRGQGAIIFVPLFDGTGEIQAVFQNNFLTESKFQLFKDGIDIGDFIEVTGVLFNTSTGEASIQVSDWMILTKAILPLPDKHAGLQDSEEKLRKRYLDILTNPELRDLIEKKSKFWRTVRDFFQEKKFLEVETPTLEITTGGAEATPFKTHHLDQKLDLYLRISIGELWQKRLMAAGIPRTFEVGRAYRNEGTSPDHAQEFTNCEFYMAYANYRDGMELTKELYRKIASEVFGTTKFTARGHSFDLNDDWQEIDYVSTVQKMTGIDIFTARVDEMKEKLKELGVDYSGEGRERLIDNLWKYCRKSISGPVFLVHHPTEIMPLAKVLASDPRKVESFNILIGGSEIGNGYSELNDPDDQRKRFSAQQNLIKAGDTEAMMPEWDFVEMLEHGMPPTCGFGFGERLFAFLVDKPIREIQTFPLVKSKK